MKTSATLLILSWQYQTNKVPAMFEPRKPSFQINVLDADSRLASFIGQRSWLLFHLLGQDGHGFNFQSVNGTSTRIIRPCLLLLVI